MIKIRKLDTTQRVYDVVNSDESNFVANGIVVHNCSEILIPVDQDHTAVCCLSSLNIERFDEWSNTTIVQDFIRFLDNVLQFFIDYAPDTIQKARRGAMRGRDLGLGMLGWHNFLMSKMVPMESGGFNSASQLAHIISKVIRDRAEAESVKLGQERGIPECGGNKRNATLIAIAPNANSSIICQTSASIEPIKANIYVHRTRVGSHVVKNKYLDKLIEDKRLEKDVVWMEILANKGSIQTLDYFTEFEKKVFKTADEIDMRYVVDQARIRQPFVDQSSSLNVFFKEGVSKKHVSDVHLRAFSRDPELPGEPLKTMYYLRAAKNARIENVSGKIVRHELKDYVSQETDKGIDLVEADKEECLSCQG